METARLLGAEQNIDSLEPGKYADILAVGGNPAENIKASRQILFVMKGGKTYRNDLAKQATLPEPE